MPWRVTLKPKTRPIPFLRVTVHESAASGRSEVEIEELPGVRTGYSDPQDRSVPIPRNQAVGFSLSRQSNQIVVVRVWRDRSSNSRTRSTKASSFTPSTYSVATSGSVTQLGVLIRQRDMEQKQGTQPNPTHIDLPPRVLRSSCRRPGAGPPAGPALGPLDKPFETDDSAPHLRSADSQFADIYTPFQGRLPAFSESFVPGTVIAPDVSGGLPIASALATQRFCLAPPALSPRAGTPVGVGEDLPSLPEPPAQSHRDGGRQ